MRAARLAPAARLTLAARLALATLVAASAGCALPRDPPPRPAAPRASASEGTTGAPSTSGDARAQPATGLAGRSLEGRPIDVQVLGQGPRTVLLLATIHGDEAAGTPLLEDLSEHLRERLRNRPQALEGVRAVIVPVLNPDGLAADNRDNAQGIDLNRDYPAANRRSSQGAERQPETRALLGLLERHRPDLVVSIHGWLGLVDWDGPGADVATAMGAACALPARQLGGRPGSLGSYLGRDAGLPVITLELPSAARSMDRAALWEQFGPALLVALEPASPAAAGPLP